MSNEQKKLTSYVLSVLVHVTFFIVIGFSALSGTSFNPMKNAEPPVNVIQATTVDKQALQQEIARLNRIDEDKKLKQQELKKQAELLKKQRIAEELQVKRLKAQELAEQEKAELQRIKAKQQLAELEAKKQQEQKQLAHAQQARAEEERKKQEIEKQRQLAEQRQKALEQQRLKALEEQRQMREAKARELVQHERQVGALVDRFGAMVKSKVTQNWIVQGQTGGEACMLRVRLAPGGIVLDVEVLQSSGDELLDRSAVAAIYKSSPLPVPTDPDAFDRMRELRLTLKPEDVVYSG